MMRAWILLLLPLWACAGGNLDVVTVNCDYRANPLGIDTAEPRLSWELESGVRGERQTAWQVLAAASLDNLAEGKADLWDSGKVLSSASVHVPYAGKPLRSGQRVYWKVPRVGCNRETVRLQQGGMVGNGAARAGGLEGELDFAQHGTGAG